MSTSMLRERHQNIAVRYVTAYSHQHLRCSVPMVAYSQLVHAAFSLLIHTLHVTSILLALLKKTSEFFLAEFRVCADSFAT